MKETFNSLFINKNNTLTKEQEAFFNSAEMKVFIAGGSGVTGVKTIGGIKEFTNYITEGGDFQHPHQVNQFFVLLQTIVTILHIALISK